ncbi:type II secretion system minor pseudopilin GspK [Pseudoduganella sp. GCM10020061]|uniref:type II secretion system minor pseudopilin GspK n=1 Tax=Pseudoduganella sp. GCM10020061 TaxID=3317345 RepID=UPI00363C6FEA
MRLTRQRGVAVVTALLLTTLAVTIVASLFWQQQVQVRTMENQRLQLQTRWILRGALDYARLILHSDASFNQWTSLDQVWATPLAETRLDQYIERERIEGESFDATLSGRIIDAASRYNLRSLADGGMIIPEEVEVFGNLLERLQLNRALAQRVAQAVLRAQVGAPPQQGAGGAAPQASGQGRPIGLSSVDDLLAVEGFTPAMVAKLREFVIVLPKRSRVNVNTASAEVLAAVMGKSVGEANALVAARKTAAFKEDSDFENRARFTPKGLKTYAVVSEWFLVESRIRLDRAALNTQALINRQLAAPRSTTLVWIRQN